MTSKFMIKNCLLEVDTVTVESGIDIPSSLFFFENFHPRPCYQNPTGIHPSPLVTRVKAFFDFPLSPSIPAY